MRLLMVVPQLRTEVVFCRGCDERMMTMMVGVRLLRSAVAVRGKIVKVVHGRQVMMATVGKIVEPSCKIVQLWNRKGYHTAKLFANGISVERTDDAFSFFMNG